MVTSEMLKIDAEQLGREANYEDLARFRCAADRLAAEKNITLGQAADELFGDGDFWPRVFAQTQTWDADQIADYLSATEMAHFKKRRY